MKKMTTAAINRALDLLLAKSLTRGSERKALELLKLLGIKEL
jgi:hypothetical protein